MILSTELLPVMFVNWRGPHFTNWETAMLCETAFGMVLAGTPRGRPVKFTADALSGWIVRGRSGRYVHAEGAFFYADLSGPGRPSRECLFLLLAGGRRPGLAEVQWRTRPPATAEAPAARTAAPQVGRFEWGDFEFSPHLPKPTVKGPSRLN